MSKHTIYTIGHSTHGIEEFIAMLKEFDIRILADIRSLPGSNKFPQFNQDCLKISLEEVGIQYLHLTNLGGRRKAKKDSKNTSWNNVSFRGYADYMETEEFENAVKNMEQIAEQQTLAYMCSEAVWWRCHRSMVSDFLKAKGWNVLHIMGLGKIQEHRYTAPARIVDDKVVYTEE
ncbi:DUF488 family protein [Flavobacterium ardleyense]|uniref:DUF488 family protein n=1 Tax=Flavobacterium ardleyense TaxID=2038737 RepID=A0ABW5Z9K5_9FLAO